MNKNLSYIGGFLIYLLLQIWVFNQIDLFSIATPHVFLLFLLLLPLSVPFSLSLFIAFLTGLSIDLFSFDLIRGVHTFSAVLMMGVRPFWINLLSNRFSYRGNEEGMLRSQSNLWYVTFFLPLILIHHIAYFTLEAFGQESLLLVTGKIIFSALYTLSWCMALTILFYKQGRR